MSRTTSPAAFVPHGVQVGTAELGRVHLGAPHEDLPRLMQEFVEFVNSCRLRTEHPVVRALLAHFFLVTIHPFGNRNGRVSRLVEAAILYEGGYNVHGFYGLSNYFYRNGDEYKRRLTGVSAKAALRYRALPPWKRRNLLIPSRRNRLHKSA